MSKTANNYKITYAEIVGGTMSVSPMELCLFWSALGSRQIELLDVRAWLACKEMMECRSEKFNKRVGVGKQWQARYTTSELAGFMQTSERAAKGAIRRLCAAGLLRWSESEIQIATRTDSVGEGLSELAWAMYEQLPKAGKKTGRKKLQLPRRVARWLARGQSISTTAVVLAECLRCLFLHKGEGWATRGRCLANWNAETFGICVRSVKSGRAKLVAMGWMSERATQGQWDLQSEGSNFEVDGWFAFTDAERAENDRRAAQLEGTTEQCEVARDEFSTTQIARGSEEKCTQSARPYINQHLQSKIESINHQPRLAPPPQTPDMVSSNFFKGGKSFPRLGEWNLGTFAKRMRLYEQLVSLGWIQDSRVARAAFEGSYRNAKTQGRNSAAVFAWRIQNNKLGFCTDTAEAGVYEQVKNYLQPVVRSAVQAVRRKVLPRDGFVVKELLSSIRKGKLMKSPSEIPRLLSQQGWSVGRANTAVSAFEQWSGQTLAPQESLYGVCLGELSLA